eukprot:NODE_6228_length_559_cov_1.425926_g6063_i0.p2 GENE.NODE_6228_length_559_cov_1.425926_g6063_i0~~NODE_6228_length_559_cov_1.425926_g6063_i0.p2  ORF type:complete len:154 (+),score=38.80 NODE_6228_length_559_cov_1.425926_g6063_i0:72-533(+)
MDPYNVENLARFKAAFDRLDVDNSGVITRENLAQVMGQSASPQQINNMIALGDFKKTGHLDFPEFLTLATSHAPPQAPATGMGDPNESLRLQLQLEKERQRTLQMQMQHQGQPMMMGSQPMMPAMSSMPSMGYYQQPTAYQQFPTFAPQYGMF